jgi:amidohydrolase
MSRSVMLPPENLGLLAEFRRRLRECAEPAGGEERTREQLRRFFQRHAPRFSCQEYEGGSLAWFVHGQQNGPTLLLRSELDALPLREETGDLGAAHCCGHDGHMAMLAGIGLELVNQPPARGRVGLLFQAGEENGTGAMALNNVERFRALRPDYVLALHNLPGRPLGEVALRTGSMCCASRGLELTLAGESSHAAHPELGRSPTAAVARLIENLGHFNQIGEDGSFVCMTTVIGARLGERHFGMTPDHAVLWATLRAHSNEAIDHLSSAVVDMVRSVAAGQDLEAVWSWQDVFPAVVNDGRACELVRAAANRAGLPLAELDAPFRWSEDFAYYGSTGPAALVGIGAGEICPALHSRDYEFPDELIPLGVSLLAQVLTELGM